MGYEDQPIFEAVRRDPFTVFMFDEPERPGAVPGPGPPAPPGACGKGGARGRRTPPLKPGDGGDFCSCGPEVREALRSRIDDLGDQGRSYEFPDCRMPEGCVPRQAVLGFLNRGGEYLLYWPSCTINHDI